MFKDSNECAEWIHARADIVVDLIRIYIGTGLFLKGVFFMFNDNFLKNILDQAGASWYVPAVMLHYIIPAHLIGGALLALGLLTRVAAAAQIPILAGAVFYVYLPHWMNGAVRQNLEFAALVLFLLVLLSVFGAGRLSVDALIERKLDTNAKAAVAA